MDTIAVLILIIAVLSFLALTLAMCTEPQEEQTNTSFNLKGPSNKNEPNMAKPKTGTDGSQVKVPIEVAASSNKLGESKPKVVTKQTSKGNLKQPSSSGKGNHTNEAKSKSSLSGKTSGTARDHHPQQPFLVDPNQVLLVDQDTYRKLEKQYQDQYGQASSTLSAHSKKTGGQSSMDTARPGSNSSRLSTLKTKSFVTEASSKDPKGKQSIAKNNK